MSAGKQRKIFPLINRETPVLDAIKAIKVSERPLLGLFAEKPEEIRSLRRGIVTGFGTALATALLLVPILARAPQKNES